MRAQNVYSTTVNIDTTSVCSMVTTVGLCLTSRALKQSLLALELSQQTTARNVIQRRLSSPLLKILNRMSGKNTARSISTSHLNRTSAGMRLSMSSQRSLPPRWDSTATTQRMHVFNSARYSSMREVNCQGAYNKQSHTKKDKWSPIQNNQQQQTPHTFATTIQI